jgi:glycosyltransferase involved in cell wall biosynthesis
MILKNKQLINVICATYNQSKELEETIKSFNEQNHGNKRLIIIDGASSDGIEEAIAGYR